jgi:hypothetical protein
MESIGTPDSETFPVIVLVSGERLLIGGVLLYEAEKVAEIAALKAQAAEKLRGVSSGIGFWGTPAYVLAAVTAQRLVDGYFSNEAKGEGFDLLRTAAMKFQRLPETAVVFPPDQVQNFASPHPENWSAVRKIEQHEIEHERAHDNHVASHLSEAAQKEPRRLEDHAEAFWARLGFKTYASSTPPPPPRTEQWYVHNGEDFVNIKTDAGMVCIRWSHVASYALRGR